MNFLAGCLRIEMLETDIHNSSELCNIRRRLKLLHRDEIMLTPTTPHYKRSKMFNIGKNRKKKLLNC